MSACLHGEDTCQKALTESAFKPLHWPVLNLAGLEQWGTGWALWGERWIQDLARLAWSQAFLSPGITCALCYPYLTPGEAFDCLKPSAPATEWTLYVRLS